MINNYSNEKNLYIMNPEVRSTLLHKERQQITKNNYEKAYGNNLQVWINVRMELFLFLPNEVENKKKEKLEKAPPVTFPDDLIKFCCFFLSLPPCTRTGASNIIRKPYKNEPTREESARQKNKRYDEMARNF